MNKIKKYELSLAVLEYLSKIDKNRYTLKSNLIGFAEQRGKIEDFLKKDFSVEEKSLLDVVLRELQEEGLIQPTFKDILNRGTDLIISDKGRKALQNKTLDALDEMLISIAPSRNLIEKRYGAYDASSSKHRDWQRHVAVSLVELIDQTLRTLTPDIDENKIDRSKKGSIRKERITRFILKRNSKKSKSTEKVVEKAFELTESLRERLEKVKHSQSDTENEVEHLIKLTEDALYFLLNR